ncbi:shikimate kinase [Clostridium thermarum]|uniref:shikimate kinase n=1 Tax=Clostridium thermarum TaxID=1716543 RepID=UPI00111EFB50|nr:shikimate kinase [Clostridium thermarum]
MNIILIGMPGAGKSTLGVLLAKALGKNFIDTDIIIQQNEGMKLFEIINKCGLKGFLDIEEWYILKLETEDSVLATGGSVVYSKKAMERLKSMGTIVYLKLQYEEIERRLKDITTRGVAIGNNMTLKELYLERKSLYEKYADIIIECDNKGIEEIVEHIIKILA